MMSKSSAMRLLSHDVWPHRREVKGCVAKRTTELTRCRPIARIEPGYKTIRTEAQPAQRKTAATAFPQNENAFPGNWNRMQNRHLADAVQPGESDQLAGTDSPQQRRDNPQ
ncbi:hypothetical protein [Noviherbaspirillum sp. UKPF54]|uniref:hypothetical protein n=1 Tax=Noviherbaspirillum sp. UKPF54 TaxID=2601898 RepID=UPI0011B10C39|nr:hypothetical protein [Noviherbaspirillum sp. UKPF54]QDZ29671.1 hypothetical protein FAY22_17915 [Noviherbaspirillum sp. UKPF54]